MRATPTAARELGLAEGTLLPPALRSWLVGASPTGNGAGSGARTAILELGGRRLRARCVPADYQGLLALLLTLCPRRPGADALIKLGLTPRQAESLELAIRGQTSAETAHQLGLSRRTIEKHLEAAYERLGARNRAEAIASAITRAAPGP